MHECVNTTVASHLQQARNVQQQYMNRCGTPEHTAAVHEQIRYTRCIQQRYVNKYGNFGVHVSSVSREGNYDDALDT